MESPPLPDTSQHERHSGKRRNRNTGDASNHLDDDNDADGIHEDPSWEEVFTTCFCHTKQGYFKMLYGMLSILACLYCFGLGLDFMANGAKVVTGCAAGSLFGNEDNATNPLTNVMIGILATVMLQSSSTTTSIIVALVGAENSIVTVQQAIYTIMGANIGTTVTNTVVSLAHFRDPSQLELAFAGATVHDLFNFMTVALLLPFEVCTGYLTAISSALTRGADTEDGVTWQGPVKRFISPLSNRVLSANKDVINAVAGGGECSAFYPIICVDNDDPTYKTCTDVGLIGCDKESGTCPLFFDPMATPRDDKISGFCVFVIGIFLIFMALTVLTIMLQRLLVDFSASIVLKATKVNGYVLIGIGTMVTTLLQSSSTTTSFLTPLVGMGSIKVEQMYPITIGANLGTTITALYAALATDGNQALQVALAHLMFNLTGMMIWYPIPFVRNLPIAGAKRLGQWARLWQGSTLVYLGVFFLAMPITVIGLTAMFVQRDNTALVAIASVVTALLILCLFFFLRWFYFLDGRDYIIDFLTECQRRVASVQELAKDMERIHKTLAALRDFTGFPQDEFPDVATHSNANIRAISKKEALNDLADDMEWVADKLAALVYYTGLPVDEQGNPDDAFGDGYDDQESTSERPPHRIGFDDDQFRPTSVWSQMPKTYLVPALLIIPLSLWGLAELWTSDSKGNLGFALFFTILLGCLVLLFISTFVSGNAGRRVLDHFEHVNKTDAAVNTLPQDMAFAKSNIRALFMHSGVKLEELRNQGRMRPVS